MASQSESEAQAELQAIQPQHKTILRTARLVLRPVRPSDIARLHQIRLNPEVMTFMSTGVETEVNPLKCHTFSRIKMMTTPGFFSFAVELNSGENINTARDESSDTEHSATLIGFIGIARPTEIFYIFDRPYWGKGYASESIKAFVPAYWANFPAGVPGTPPDECDALTAYVYDGNTSSEKVVMKAGFELIVRGFVDGYEQAVFVTFRPECLDKSELLKKLRGKEEMTAKVV